MAWYERRVLRIDQFPTDAPDPKIEADEPLYQYAFRRSNFRGISSTIFLGDVVDPWKPIDQSLGGFWADVERPRSFFQA